MSSAKAFTPGDVATACLTAVAATWSPTYDKSRPHEWLIRLPVPPVAPEELVKALEAHLSGRNRRKKLLDLLACAVMDLAVPEIRATYRPWPLVEWVRLLVRWDRREVMVGYPEDETGEPLLEEKLYQRVLDSTYRGPLTAQVEEMLARRDKDIAP